MGFFFEKLINQQKTLLEADDTENTTQDGSTTEDYTSSDTETNNDDTGNDDQQASNNDTDDSTDDQQQDDNNQDDQNDDTTDYTDSGDDDFSDSSDGDDSGDQSDSGSSQDNEEQPVDDIKAQEEEIYSSLSAEQLDIKHKELKTQFLSMFDLTTSIAERINDAAISEENIGTIEYVSNTLSDLRDMISDYMNSVYQTKSYIENSINYNRFLAVLNGINKILEEIYEKEE